MNMSTMDNTTSNPRPRSAPLEGSPGIERPNRLALPLAMALGCAVMLAAGSDPANAQVLRLDNCLVKTVTSANTTYTNNCNETISVTGALQAAGGGGCVALSGAEIAATTGNNTVSYATSRFPGRVCFEYKSARTQYQSGYLRCSSITTDLGACGQGGALSEFIPGQIPDGTITLSQSSVSITETGSTSVTVSLTATDTDAAGNPVPPLSDIVLNVSSSDSDAASVGTASMTFGRVHYGTSQTLNITAPSDTDTNDETVTVTLSAATTSGLHLADVTIAVSVTDQNQMILLSTSEDDDHASNAIEVDEGDTRSYSVKLQQAPAGDQIVTVATADHLAVSVSSTSDTNTTDNQVTLTFNSTNYQMNQALLITGAQDADGTNDADVIITLSAGNADNVTRKFTIIDDDGSIDISSAAVVATEGGTAGTFTVELGAPPAASVQLDVTSSDTNAATVSPATLTFTTSNYNTAKTVTVTGVQDTDGTDDATTITLAVNDDDAYTASSAQKAVAVHDDDGAINLSSGAIELIEDSSTDGSEDFTVTLAAPPASGTSAVISVVSDNTAVGTVSPATLTFSDTNYNTAQTVTITAASDADGTDGQTIIKLDDSSGYRAPEVDKTFEVIDDDGEIILSQTGKATINEEASSTFTVTLGAPPAINAAISVTSKDETVARVSPSRLTFNPSNWNTAQEVTIEAARDKDYDDESTEIEIVATNLDDYRVNTDNPIDYSNDNDKLKREVDVTDTDNPPTGRIVIRKTTADAGIVEGAGGDVWGISLVEDNATDPIIFDTTVSLTVGGTDTGAVTVSPSTLTFLPMNPNKEQLVTITPTDDSNYDDESASITLSASATTFNAPSQTIPITVIDDDTPPSGSIVLDDTGVLTLEEGGSGGTFTVKLGGSTVPAFPVFVSLESSDPGAIRVSPETMNFNSTNSTVARTVTVTAVNDSNYDDESASILLTTSGGLSTPSVTKLIKVNDDDIEPLLVLSEERLSLGENQSTTINISLNQPTPVPVNISVSASSSDIVVEPSSFSFETVQWNRPYPVSVYVHADNNARDDFGTITFTASTNKIDSIFQNVVFELPIVMTEVTAPGGGGGDKPSPPAPTLSVQSHALAIPPPSAQDQANVRIWCRHQEPCNVSLECSAQEDGMFMEGRLAQPIPSMGTVTLSATEIAEIIGGSWEGKGRLGCALRSDGDLIAQVWTRSGDGVLINNSATLRSVDNRVDIHDIPAPDSSDISNIRIRCPTEYAGDCQNVSLKCHDNDGMPYTGFLGTIERGAVFHMQTADLSEIIVHQWQGSDLFCQVSGSRPFTVQVLTRTGGGGALVNNSASGGGLM